MSFWEPLRAEEDTAAQAASSGGQLPQNIASLTPQGQITAFFFFRYKAGREKTTRTARTISVIVFLCHLDTS